jgi:hypothetical protein
MTTEEIQARVERLRVEFMDIQYKLRQAERELAESISPFKIGDDVKVGKAEYKIIGFYYISKTQPGYIVNPVVNGKVTTKRVVLAKSAKPKKVDEHANRRFNHV